MLDAYILSRSPGPQSVKQRRVALICAARGTKCRTMRGGFKCDDARAHNRCTKLVVLWLVLVLVWFGLMVLGTEPNSHI